MKKKERNLIPNRNRQAILEKKQRKSKNARPKFGLPLDTYSIPKFMGDDNNKFLNYHTFAKKALRRYLKGDYDFFYKNQYFIIPVNYNNNLDNIENEEE